MAVHDAYARMTPFELLLPSPEYAERRFAAIGGEADARGADPANPAAFMMLSAVQGVIGDLQEEGADPARANDHASALFFVYHMWRSGEPVALARQEAVRAALEEEKGGEGRAPRAGLAEAERRLRGRSGYLQLPQHLVWVEESGAPEAGGRPSSINCHGDNYSSAPESASAPARPGAPEAGGRPSSINCRGDNYSSAPESASAPARPDFAAADPPGRRQRPGQRDREAGGARSPAPQRAPGPPKSASGFSESASAPPESADGIFWHADPGGAVHLAVAAGMREGRPGFSFMPLPPQPLRLLADWASRPAREHGPDFASSLPGAEIEGLLALRTPAEAYKLTALLLLRLARAPSVDPLPPPEAADPGRAAGPRPTSLPWAVLRQ